MAGLPGEIKSFMGTPVNSTNEMVRLAKEWGMKDEEILRMLGGLFKAPTVVAAPSIPPGLSGGTPKPPAWLERDRWGGIDSPDSLLRMLAMRFRLQDGQMFPFEFIMPTKSKDKVIVFLVVNGEPTYVEDGADLYPSDALITKLRLIAQP